MREHFEKFLSIIFPTKCPICSSIIRSGSHLCFKCWGEVDFISDPACKKCSYPFEFDIGVDSLCGSCIENEHYFDSAMSVMRYGDSSKKIIHKLKYSDKAHLAKNIARLMHAKIQSKIGDIDLIIPVPMHRRKIRKRLYNQSALIASHLSKISNIASMPNCLIKTRHHVPQTGLCSHLRKDNVKNSFSVNKNHFSEIHNKNILLVDDVYTTGSTVDECSKVLKQSYCNKVKVITLARVV